MIEGINFHFKLKDDDFSLFVDGESFENIFKETSELRKKSFSTFSNIETKNSFKLEEKQISYNTTDDKTKGKFGLFSFEWQNGVCIVKRTVNFAQLPNKLSVNRFNIPKKENEQLLNHQLQHFKFLDDSAELYTHDFLFLFTQDFNEDLDMVRSVNQISGNRKDSLNK